MSGVSCDEMELRRRLISLGVMFAAISVGAQRAGAEARAEGLYWNVRTGYNAVARLIRTPREVDGEKTFYLGEVPNPEACRKRRVRPWARAQHTRGWERVRAAGLAGAIRRGRASAMGVPTT